MSRPAGGSAPVGSPTATARIIEGFQSLRQEQRALASKLTELEQELNEHKIVIDTLKTVNEDRKCFQMIGGVLFEKKVKDVLPALTTNKEMLNKVITSLSEKLTKKGVEINEYKEKHDIRIRGQNDLPQEAEAQAPPPPTKSNVLVSES